MGGLVSATTAAGAMGTGRPCGYGCVRAGNTVSRALRSAVWMLQLPTRWEAKEEETAAEVKECNDLDAICSFISGWNFILEFLQNRHNV